MTAVAHSDLPRHRFTVAEYDQMGRTGVLRADERYELLDGEIVMMSPTGPRHAGQVDRLTQLLTSQLGNATIVRVQNPLVVGPHSEPEPDLAVLRKRSDFYTMSHPQGDDTLLVIEVADTSLAKDRDIKTPLYAAGRVPEVWVVDVDTATIDVHRKPAATGYTDVTTAGRGDTLTPDLLDGVTLTVDEILGLA